MKFQQFTFVLTAVFALALPLLADTAPDAAPAATSPAAHKHHSKAAKPDPATEAMMKKSDCFTCHSVNAKIIGPAYKDVAKKYRNVPNAEAKLVEKVKAGGSGNWGAIPMVAHPQLSDVQLHAMVKWVLAH